MSIYFMKLIPVVAGAALLVGCQGNLPVESGSHEELTVVRQQVHQQEPIGTDETTTQPQPPVVKQQSVNNLFPVPSPSPSQESSPVQSLW